MSIRSFIRDFATAKPGAAGYLAVFVYHENAFQDGKPPVINAYGPWPKRHKAQYEVTKTKKQFRAENRPGQLFAVVRPIITDSMVNKSIPGSTRGLLSPEEDQAEKEAQKVYEAAEYRLTRLAGLSQDQRDELQEGLADIVEALDYTNYADQIDPLLDLIRKVLVDG
jgi:hypothetical protein